MGGMIAELTDDPVSAFICVILQLADSTKITTSSYLAKKQSLSPRLPNPFNLYQPLTIYEHYS